METFIAKLRKEYRTIVSPKEIYFVGDVELIDVFAEHPYVAGYDKLGRFWISYDSSVREAEWDCKDCIWERYPRYDKVT